MSPHTTRVPTILGYITEKTDCENVLREMAEYLAAAGFVKETYCQAVLDRENAFPTGVPSEPIPVAIPHSDRGHVIKTAILVAKTAQPIPFRRIDDPNSQIDVRAIFMLAIDSNQGQLDVITQIMDLIQDAAVIESIVNASDPQAIQSAVECAFTARQSASD